MLRIRLSIELFVVLIMVGIPMLAPKALAQKTQKVKAETFDYSPPTLNVTADQSVIRLCEGDKNGALVRLNAVATSPDGQPIRYHWTSEVGRIEGAGPTVTWDLAGVQPGVYKAFVEIDTGNGDRLCQAFSSTALLVECSPQQLLCPNVAITCPDKVEREQPVTFTSVLSGNLGNVTPVYSWTVSNGRIIEGQGTSSIRVDTTGLAGQALTATISILGYNLDCSASCVVQLPVQLTCRRFDEFPAIARNDEKARLDNFAIELQNDPSAKAYVVVHPGERGRQSDVRSHMNRIVDYLVNSRGLDTQRIVTMVGSPRPNLSIDLWLCPQGAPPPKP